MANKIMIDPGHAPGNPNHGPTGYYEYEGMWKLSNFLKEELERCGFQAGLTRSENECPTLTSRGECAQGCEAFISEHSNAGGGKGCECYYSVRLPEDKDFASDLAAAVSGVLGDSSRGAKTWHSTIDSAYDYLTVMGSAVNTGCPHVFLCENGFHDNASDEAQLKSEDKLREMAKAQTRVICSHLNVSYKEGNDGDSSEKTEQSTNEGHILTVGDKVTVKPGVSSFADGTGMASFIRTAVLYVRQIGEGKILVSTQKEGAVTGWVKTTDLLYADDETEVSPPSPASESPSDQTPASLQVGDRVHIRDGVTTFADGVSMASFVRSASLYIRYIGVGKVLVSTQEDGAVTGWVKAGDVVKD